MTQDPRIGDESLGADAAAVENARSAEPVRTGKHTPGPWSVGPHTDCGSLSRYGSCGGGWPVDGPSDGPHGYSNQADAHLIAAAPELYEALKRAREALKANEDITGTWDLYQSSPEMKAINAALAKAEGRK